MSCDHEIANEWAHFSGKNASYITIPFIAPGLGVLGGLINGGANIRTNDS